MLKSGKDCAVNREEDNDQGKTKTKNPFTELLLQLSVLIILLIYFKRARAHDWTGYRLTSVRETLWLYYGVKTVARWSQNLTQKSDGNSLS